MKKIISSIGELLSDERGRLSSKRLVGIICGLTLCLTLYENSFTQDNIVPSNALVESVAALCFGCLGLASLDKFTFLNKGKKEENTEQKSEEQQ